MRRKLFIFEPYRWAYGSGVIGVIAIDFKEAMDILIKDGYQHKFWEEKPTKQEAEGGVDTQWVLTHIVQVDWEEESYVLFDNWNFS